MIRFFTAIIASFAIIVFQTQTPNNGCLRLFSSFDPTHPERAVPRGIFDLGRDLFTDFQAPSVNTTRELRSPDGQNVAYLEGAKYGDGCSGLTLMIRPANSWAVTDGIKVADGLVVCSENPHQWTSFVWSPDSRWLLYSADGSLFIVKAPGQHMSTHNLNDNLLGDHGGSFWSADGNFGATIQDRFGLGWRKIYIWHMPDLTPLNPCILQGNSGPGLQPGDPDTCAISYSAQDFTWSPHGHLLAFLGTTNPPSDDRTKLTLLDAATGTVHIYSLHGIATQAPNEPLWSPDGTHVAVSLRQNSQTEQLDVVSTGGGEVINITTQLEVDSPRYMEPMLLQWSADGCSLFYLNRDNNGTTNLMAFRVAKHNAEILSRSDYPRRPTAADFSPDWSHVVISRWTSTAVAVSILNTSDGSVVDLESESEDVKQANWSQNGRWVVVLTDAGLMVAGADGQIIYELPGYRASTAMLDSNDHYQWSADGNWLYIYKPPFNGLEAVPLTSGSEQTLTLDPVTDVYPDPQNDAVVFRTAPAITKPTQLILKSLIDSSEHTLTTVQTDQTQATWSADGTLIAVVSHNDQGSYGPPVKFTLDVYDSTGLLKQHVDDFPTNAGIEWTACPR